MDSEQELRDRIKVEDIIKTNPRYMADHAYLSVKPPNFSEHILHQDLYSFFSFCSQHRQLRCTLPPMRSLKWDSSKFLRTQLCLLSLSRRRKTLQDGAGI